MHLQTASVVPYSVHVCCVQVMSLVRKKRERKKERKRGGERKVKQ